MSGFLHITDKNFILPISKQAVNQSIEITGESGKGKSTALKIIAVEKAKEGQNVLAFNFGGTFEDVLYDDRNYHLIKVKKEGIPVPLLECFDSPCGGREDEADVSEAIAEAFSEVAPIGYMAKYLLETACQKAIRMRGAYSDDMKCLFDAIISQEDDEKKILLAKYSNVLTRVKFKQNFDLWEPKKVSVLDFSGYPLKMQLLLTQLILSVFWRWYRIFGQQMEGGTMLVLDEFQNLPLKDDSILTQILREGRKFKLSLLLATQTIFSFDVAKRIILQQPGTKLYFKPVESEVKKIAKLFPDINAADAERLLQTLKIGECLACGEFEIAGSTKFRTLKLSFVNRE